MRKTEITERDFKAACLKCLLRGGITDTEREVITAFCNSKKTITARAATQSEENELETARRENRLKEFLARPSIVEPPPSTLFDRVIYLKAVKNGFDTVKDWFKQKFGGTDIVVVWFGDVKPNLNPNANPHGNK